MIWPFKRASKPRPLNPTRTSFESYLKREQCSEGPGFTAQFRNTGFYTWIPCTSKQQRWRQKHNKPITLNARGVWGFWREDFTGQEKGE